MRRSGAAQASRDGLTLLEVAPERVAHGQRQRFLQGNGKRTALVELVAQHRDGLRTRSRVAQLGARWVAHGRPADLLLPHGKELDEARGMLAAAQFSLTAQEVELIGASVRKARRRERIRLAVLVLIATLAIVASVAGVSALRDKQIARQRRAEAEGLMGFMLSDFADKLRPLARLDLLDGVSAKALEYLAVSDGDTLSAASLTHRAKASQVIGEVRTARGDPKAAHDARTPSSNANAFWLGKLQLDQGAWESSRRFFTQYRDYADRLSALDPASARSIPPLSTPGSSSRMPTTVSARWPSSAATRARRRWNLACRSPSRTGRWPGNRRTACWPRTWPTACPEPAQRMR